MQIIPSAVYRVGDRPNMTSRDEQKTAGFAPSLRQTLLGWPFLHAGLHACVNGNGTSVPRNRAQAHSTAHTAKGKNKIGAPAAAS